MADQEKDTATRRRISPEERFHYIGFDVFPGKPGEFFRSDSEKAKYVEDVVKKRTRGDQIREQCTLIIERLSKGERWVLTIASVLVILSVVLPWYGAYKETEIKPAVTTTTGSTSAESGATGTNAATPSTGSNEQILTAARSQKRMHRETTSLSGIGAIGSIGSVGSYVFSGGIVLMLTGVIMLVLTLLAIALPIYILVTLLRQKTLDDAFALRFKRTLRLAWIPVGLFFLALILSFFGADYGSGTVGTYTSLGQSYGPAVFLSTLNFGLIIAIGGFLVLATKGVEI